MQRTANFHEQVADPRLPHAAGVVDDAASLDAAVDMLDAHPPTSDMPIGGFLLAREGPAPWLLRRHDSLHLVQRQRQEAQILELPAPRWHGVRGGIGHTCIVGTVRRGRTQKG
jgi:hypothetical protein